MIMVKVVALIVCLFYTDGHHEIRVVETKAGFMECMDAANKLRTEFEDPDVSEVKAACLEWNAFVKGSEA